MSNLKTEIEQLESEYALKQYLSEVVDQVVGKPGWQLSRPRDYDKLIEGAEETISGYLDSDLEQGRKSILSYSGDGELTEAVLTLEFPDVEREQLIGGNLGYRVNHVINDLSKEVSRINKAAVKQRLEDSNYFESIPENIDYLPKTDIAQVSISADADPQEFGREMSDVTDVVRDLDEFYESDFESVMKSTVRDFMSTE